MYGKRREDMVERQIASRGIVDERVLGAMRKVERHLFVDENTLNSAYNDHPLPIGYGQTISQPYIVAYMTEIAEIGPDDRVLEIGTGSGYQAAILAEIAKEVYTVEILEPLAEHAEKILKDLGYTNIKVRSGDGYKGWIEYAPFDVIVVTAAPPEIPLKLIDQLKLGGRMVIPVGQGTQELYLITRTESGFDKRSLLPVRFVPMVNGE
ncbi:MAG: protein-L-isoaspartate(D-aspartate) O-methyltransferase [Candidatus Omnitrophota bacterium]